MPNVPNYYKYSLFQKIVKDVRIKENQKGDLSEVHRLEY